MYLCDDDEDPLKFYHSMMGLIKKVRY